MSGDARHTIEARISTGDYFPALRFICHGTVESSCHQIPECPCEEWTEECAAEHPRLPHDYCWAQDWFDEGEIVEMYEGPPDAAIDPTRDVSIIWNGDHVTWSYKGEVAA